MNLRVKKSVKYILLFFTLTPVINAQEAGSLEPGKLVIPPLNVVIDSAIQNAPVLKAKAKEISIIGQELNIEKKRWMEHIFIEGATNYGLFEQVLISGQTTDGAFNTGLLTKSEQVRYYGG
ncbi:MAG: hypothetical protein DRQ01_09785, partial [Ignavibacteriae bacterium]